MDDPTRRCENDTGNETRLSGLPIPSGGPFNLLSMLMFHRSATLSALMFMVSFGHELLPPEVAGLQRCAQFCAHPSAT